MLYFERIDVFEGIDFNHTSQSKECNICHYWYFLDKGIKFQPVVCSGCHQALMISINLSHIAILNIDATDYLCILSEISKSEAINLMQNINLTQEKHNIIKNTKHCYHIQKWFKNL